MDFFEVLGKMSVIMFAMAVGYFANRKGYLGGEVDQKLCKLLLNITLPSMILATVIAGDTMATVSDVLSILKVSVCFYGVAFAMAFIVPVFLGGTPAQKGVWRYTLTFSNIGFIGYPVATALFGEESLFYAALLALPFNLLSFTLGPLMLAGIGRFKWKQLFSPCVVASVVALICALTSYQPPRMIGGMFKFVGDITVPLSLLVVGSLLAGMSVKQVLASPRIWILTVLRLVVLPIILFVVLQPLHLEYMVLGVAITQMAMPVAINGSLMCVDVGGDAQAMAQTTFLTTVMSLVTIPLVVALLL